MVDSERDQKSYSSFLEEIRTQLHNEDEFQAPPENLYLQTLVSIEQESYFIWINAEEDLSKLDFKDKLNSF
jgi:hypothetical protein